VKKFLLAFFIAVLLVGLIAAPTLAAGPKWPPCKPPIVKPPPPPKLATITLCQKNPTDWSVVKKGACGMLTYNQSGPKFCYVFGATGLAKKTDYSLIYYADKPNRMVNWGGDNPGALIVTGKTDKWGKLCLFGSKDLNMDLPCPPDTNYPTGAKVWLVLSSDYNGSRLTAWNPTAYLFGKGDDQGKDLVKYDDTDVSVLVLENKGPNDWSTIITGDNIEGGLVYSTSGPTFNYSFCADVDIPTTGTDYWLIYYADPWPGNNPGYCFGGAGLSTMEDGKTGLVRWNGQVTFNSNLPDPADQNSSNGYNAKIWFIPMGAYDGISKSVTSWPLPDSGSGQVVPYGWLFEMNGITYTYTP